KDIFPTNSTPVATSTPGPCRWKLWKSDWSLTVSWYEPGSRRVTRAPWALVTVIPESPIDPKSAVACAWPAELRDAPSRTPARRSAATTSDRLIARFLRASITIGLLAAELGAEPLRKRGDDALARSARLLLGQRPLRRLEREVDGDRLASGADLVAAVDVEHARLPQQLPGCAAGRVHESSDLDVLVDGDGDVLEYGRVRQHVLVDDALGHILEQGLEIQLEGAPPPFEEGGMKLAEPAGVGLGGLAGMQ